MEAGYSLRRLLDDGTFRDLATGTSFNLTGVPATQWLAAQENDVGLRMFYAGLEGGFSECTGLEMSLEVQELNQGGGNDGTLKFPTRIKPAPLVLKRGLTTDTSLWQWFYSFVQGTGKRRDGTITVNDAAHNEVTVWGFRRGLPT